MTDNVQPFNPTRLTPADLDARRIGPGPGPAAPAGARPGESFADALRTAEGPGVRFSNHAEERLRTRDIRLTAADTARIDQAIDIARSKGAQESLILYDDLALIVSIRNRLVITALERGESQPSVFTHIDSAVVMPGQRS